MRQFFDIVSPLEDILSRHASALFWLRKRSIVLLESCFVFRDGHERYSDRELKYSMEFDGIRIACNSQFHIILLVCYFVVLSILLPFITDSIRHVGFEIIELFGICGK